MSNADLNCSLTVNTDEHGQDNSNVDAETDVSQNSFNNSIIGKVKSRVSGILPNTLSKWFSSSKSKEELDNSSPSTNITSNMRRRKRSALESESNEEIANESNEDFETNPIQLNEPAIINTQRFTAKYGSPNISLEPASNNFTANDGLSNYGATSTTNTFKNLKKLDLKSKEPPIKRQRYTEQLEDTFLNSLEQRQPLLASTPAIENNLLERNSRKSALMLERGVTSRSKFLNLYGHQEQREPAYNLNLTVDEPDRDTNIVNSLKRNPNLYESTPTINSTNELNTNLPVVSQRCTGLLDLKRQKLEVGSTAVIENEANKDLNVVNKLNGVTKHEFEANGGNNVEASGEESGNERRSECGDADNNNYKRNVSRTSSFGNGINFYAHLVGKKSLFTNANEQALLPNSILNNSTLSLTSLHRRRFNDSIYGSTSALSDSRLLNIHSPFYKGNTSYGGAASYNRYNYKGNNNSMLSMRALATQMRPTSSLSSVSSTTQSNLQRDTSIDTQQATNNISNTAKRILDLINDFNTPLNEARKMAHNLNNNENSRRLTDHDVKQTRAMRLSHMQTPYMRAAVTLQPNKLNGNKTTTNTTMPPVRELQVPSMSQLLKLKNLQNTTENSRKIIHNNNNYNINNNNNNINSKNKLIPTEYTLPTNVLLEQPKQQLQQQKTFSGKIKNKITAPTRESRNRVSNNDELDDVELPNIAFPLMENVPKFDIQLPAHVSFKKIDSSEKRTAATTTTITTTTTQLTSFNVAPMKAPNAFNSNANTEKSNSGIKATTPNNNTNINCKEDFNKNEFVFSRPQRLNSDVQATQLTVNKSNNFTFCGPTLLNSTVAIPATTTKITNVVAQVPQLKSGSCLDALKTPLLTTSTSKPIDAWSMAKKATNEWECDACMLRNKSDAVKCVACETPHKSATTVTVTVTAPAITTNTFGDAFKRKSNSWECPTCMINNQTTDICCVACQTKNPKASDALTTSKVNNNPSVSAFKFGFAATTATIQTPTITATTTQSKSSGDALFKSLASAQAAKWECDACMTRNENSRSKCVCCDQAKPGAVNSELDASTPKFSFGETSKNKFTFGFAQQKTTVENIVTTTITTNTSSNFNAGNKDVADAKQPVLSGFKFGTSTAVSSSAGFTFGLGANKNSTASSTETVTTNSVSSHPVASVKFSLPTTGSGVTSSSDAKTTTSDATPTKGALENSGFSFGLKSNSTTQIGTTVSSTSGTFTLASNSISTPSSTLSGKSTMFTLPTTTATSSETKSGFSFGTNNVTTTASSLMFGGFTANATKPIATTTTVAATITTNSSMPGSVNTTTTTTTSSLASVSSAGFGRGTFGGFKTTLSTSGSSTTTNTTSTSNTTQNSLFGSIKSDGTTPPPPFFFGANSNKNTSSNNNNETAVSSSSTTTGNNSWATFGNVQKQTTSTITSSSDSSNAKPLFGNFGQTPVSNTGSIFGTVPKSTETNINTSNSPKPSFGGTNTNLFGNVSFGASPIGSNSTPAFATNTFGNKTNSTPTFGSNANAPPTFGSNTSTTPAFNSNTNSTPTFGSGTANAAPTFGSHGNSTATFGSKTNATPVFGSSNTSAIPAFGSNTNVTPTFGSTTNATPTFGSTNNSTPAFGASSSVAKTSTFGSFGTLSSANTNTNANTEPKKTESLFSFGAAGCSNNNNNNNNNNAQATTQINVFGSMNNMGANNAKPAFNFTPVNQPAFNFTRTVDQTPSTAPFQFGASPSAAPVYNFSAGNVEKPNTPTAPFQFNATVANPATNIFAPAPNTGVQSAAQQARRKIRTPVRRLPPR